MKNLNQTLTGCEDINHQFESLQARMLGFDLRETRELELCRLLCLAANEAAAMAWLTPYPLLVFPGLFEEKAGDVRRYFARQQAMRTAQMVSQAPASRKHLQSLCKLHPGLDATRLVLVQFQAASATSAA